MQSVHIIICPITFLPQLCTLLPSSIINKRAKIEKKFLRLVPTEGDSASGATARSG
jgi:hypothetical protein